MNQQTMKPMEQVISLFDDNYQSRVVNERQGCFAFAQVRKHKKGILKDKCFAWSCKLLKSFLSKEQ